MPPTHLMTLTLARVAFLAGCRVREIGAGGAENGRYVTFKIR